MKQPTALSKTHAGSTRNSGLLSSTTLASAGFQDWHHHIDRANTFRPEFFAHQGPLEGFIDAPLPVKQIAVGVLHRGLAYTRESLVERMTAVIEAKIAAGETFLNAIVDCSPDIEGRSFEAALELRETYKDRMTINVGAYPIFGFKTHGSDRQQHLAELAARAQFLVGLPERDHRPGHADHTVTFDDHLAILIELAIQHQIPLQVHVDQTNTPEENGTERLIDAVHWLITSRLPKERRPKVWAVHAISPSSYDEERFERLTRGLKENNIGVICCPHAAISMRQMRNTSGPSHNSIARIRELAIAGVEVRLGTDNINDLFMPWPKSVLLEREMDILASSIRYYNENVLGKIARGEHLNETDIDSLTRSVAADYEAFGWAHIGSRRLNGRR